MFTILAAIIFFKPLKRPFVEAVIAKETTTPMDIATPTSSETDGEFLTVKSATPRIGRKTQDSTPSNATTRIGKESQNSTPRTSRRSIDTGASSNSISSSPLKSLLAGKVAVNSYKNSTESVGKFPVSAPATPKTQQRKKI